MGTRRSAIGHSFFFLPPVTVLACVANSLNPWYDRMYRVLYLGLEWQVRMQPRLKQSQKSLQKITRPSFLLVSKVANKEKRERRLGREGNRPSLHPASPPLLTSATQANRRYCPGQSDFPWTMNKLIRSRTKYIFVADDKPGKTQASNMISTVGFYFWLVEKVSRNVL